MSQTYAEKIKPAIAKLKDVMLANGTKLPKSKAISVAQATAGMVGAGNILRFNEGMRATSNNVLKKKALRGLVKKIKPAPHKVTGNKVLQAGALKNLVQEVGKIKDKLIGKIAAVQQKAGQFRQELASRNVEQNKTTEPATPVKVLRDVNKAESDLLFTLSSAEADKNSNPMQKYADLPKTEANQIAGELRITLPSGAMLIEKNGSLETHGQATLEEIEEVLNSYSLNTKRSVKIGTSSENLKAIYTQAFIQGIKIENRLPNNVFSSQEYLALIQKKIDYQDLSLQDDKRKEIELAVLAKIKDQNQAA